MTLIRGARQLLTLHGPPGPRRGPALKDLGVIQDGAVLVADGRIVEVGPTRRVENLSLARGADEIDASGRVVMPGFVDSHTHIVGGPARVPEYDMQLAGNGAYARASGAVMAMARTIHEVSPKTLEAQSIRVLEEALRNGTTTLEAKSGFGLTEPGEFKILRVHSALQKLSLPVVSTYLAAHVPPDYQDRQDQFIRWVCSRILPMVKRRKLAEFADIRCEQGAFTVDQAHQYLCAARDLGFGLKLHAGRSPLPGAVRMGVDMGVASIDNMIEVSEEEAGILARSSTIATLLPGTVFYMGTQRYAPARMLVDRGVAVALATNYNPETSPSQNMQMVIALAHREMNLTAAEAIAAATINGAYALRMESKVGSIERGKTADLLLLGVPDYREIPYHFGVNLVDLVMKSGTVVLKRSEVKWAGN